MSSPIRLLPSAFPCQVDSLRPPDSFSAALSDSRARHAGPTGGSKARWAGLSSSEGLGYSAGHGTALPLVAGDGLLARRRCGRLAGGFATDGPAARIS